MTSEIATCRIWGQDYTAVGQSIPDPSKVVVTESDRAGGGYVIIGDVDRHITDLEDGEEGSTYELAGRSAAARQPPSRCDR